MSTATPFEVRLSVAAARGLSIFVYAALLLGNFGVAVGVPEPRIAALAVSLLKIAGLLGALILFLSSYGQLSQKAEADLDEREVAIRNRAYVLTHQIMVAVLFLGFLWVTLADKLGWWLPGASDAADLITAFGLGSMALPAAILAWRDRAPADEEGA
ncbi:hypothetical protein [Thermaurantiacus sp.]